MPFRRESMGIAADGSQKAFPSKDVDAFLDRPRLDIQLDSFRVTHSHLDNHFILAVDPAGGGSSAFAVCSMLQYVGGEVTVRAASCPGARPPTSPPAPAPAPRRSRAPGSCS